MIQTEQLVWNFLKKVSEIMKAYKLLCLILALSLCLTGCIGMGNKGIGADSGYTPQGGGTLNLSSYSPDTLNPLSTKYGCIRDFLYLAYEGLFIVNEDLGVTPVLAEEYRVSDKNKTYRISLKKGVKFHDGSSFTAKDVIATFDYIRTYDTPYSYALNNVSLYRADGDYAVVLELKSPMANFLGNLDFPILSSGLKYNDFSLPNSEYKINGTGRYKYASEDAYSSLTLEKNPSWHKEDPVYIPRVNIRYVNDNDAMLYAFDSGETDMISTERGRWGEFPYSTACKTYEITTTGYVYVGINTTSSAFSDIELRKSLYAVIDKEHIADTTMFSHAQIADTPISSKAYFYRNDDSEDKGYTADAFSGKKDMKVFVLYNTESKYKEGIAKYIADELRAIGINADISGVDYETYIQKVSSGDYQLYIGEVNMSKDCDLKFMFDTHEDYGVDWGDETIVKLPESTHTTYNRSGICDYSDSKLDDIISNINSAKDKEALSMAYNNLNRFFAENVPQIPLFHKNDALLINQRVKGKPNVNLTNFYADIGKIYIQ